MIRKPAKPDHPWKKSFTVRKAAEDRKKKKQREQLLFEQGKLTRAI